MTSTILGGMVAPDLFTRSLNRLLGRNEEHRRLLRNIRERVGFHLGAGFQRWLDKAATWDAIVLAAPEGHTRLLQDLVDELTEDWNQAGWPISSELTARARLLLDATYDGVLETADPARATAIGTARLEGRLDDVRQDIAGLQDSVETLGRPDAESRLAALPPTTLPPLRRLLAEHPTMAGRVLAILATGREALAGMSSYSSHPPGWLADASADAWLALAEFAEAHRDFQLAVGLFARAADLSPERGRWTLRAALCQFRATSAAGAQQLLDEAAAFGAERGLLLAARGGSHQHRRGFG